MAGEITAYEKGLALEQRLERLFSAKGYDVVHNTVMTGRSGAGHQIDLLVAFRSPLHTSTLIVEAKSYQTTVDKDRIMKLIQIVDDLGVDRGIIITTSDFTPAALKTAEGHNVELWNREKLASLLGEIEISAVESGLPANLEIIERAIKPRFATEDIQADLQQELDKKARGGLFGVGKVVEHIDAIFLTFYPYYEAVLELRVTEQQRVGLLKKELIHKVALTKVSFDAVLGSLVSVGPLGISYDFAYLMGLTADEVTLLRAVAGRTFSRNTLMALGFSEGKTKRLLGSLQGKGMIERLQTRPVSFSCGRWFPNDPLALTAVSEAHALEEIGGTTAGAKYRGELKEPNAVLKAAESYWTTATVKSLALIYYPYVVAALERADASKRVVVIDAITGQPNELLEKLPWQIERVSKARGLGAGITF